MKKMKKQAPNREICPTYIIKIYKCDNAFCRKERWQKHIFPIPPDKLG